MAVQTVNVSFQADLLRAIDAEAKREDRSRSELLREAARLYVERQRRWDTIFQRGDEIAGKKHLTEDDIPGEIAAYRQARRVRT